MERLPWQWWGLGLRYGEVLARQEALRERVLSGEDAECLGLLEHQEVITLGRRPVKDVPSAASLAELGVDFHQTRRGGEATWHGPGQLVGYLICAVGRRNWTVRGTVASIEEGLIRWLNGVGIIGETRCEHPGVWVGERKIASLGLHFRKGVSMHGFALNLGVLGSGARLISPCGLSPDTLTSVEAITGLRLSPETAAPEVGELVIDSLPWRRSS